jgi:hypothetical protein
MTSPFPESARAAPQTTTALSTSQDGLPAKRFKLDMPASASTRVPLSSPNSRRAIRSATLIGYAKAAASVGLDPEAMMIRVGLDPSCMANWETRISLDAYLALLAASAVESRCGDFGTRAAMARGLPDYGVVSLALREAETVKAALGLYSSHLTLHCDDIAIELDQRHDLPFITPDLPGNTPEEVAQATQFCMVGITRQLRWLTGGEFQPSLICFAFTRPASVFPPLRYIDCQVAYDQAVSAS